MPEINPGQRDGLLAMGTGSGKTLVFMVGASVADA
jgi:superfamily II DNA or RNA helicase